jgi:type II restriction enzyme
VRHHGARVVRRPPSDDARSALRAHEETALVERELVRTLIARWRDDPGSTYRTWFLWEERLKNFRSIRRGLAEVAGEIEAGTFGNVYKGSSLETVVGSIAEQRQIFKGADHAFLWKPKLRIPDIYENRDNQAAFGRFLQTCACCTHGDAIVAAIQALDAVKVKGLGPAVANLLYFLHPTLATPFNTKIVQGFNALTGAKVKLGRWTEYLAMRERIVAVNEEHRDLLSNDLGAVAGLLFDLGSGRYPVPAREVDAAGKAAWDAELARVREAARPPSRADEADRSHTEIQTWLRDLGIALGFGVWIAANDRGRPVGTGRLGDGCLDALPQELVASEAADAIRLIDVIWLDRATGRVAAAFEVEHTTSIHSGIVRMLDLVAIAGGVRALFLVAPDDREDEVRAQLARPAFRQIATLDVRYLSYGELSRHRESIARFGTGLKGIEAIARRLA